MALIELRNVGKIYVSEGNVSVGIRGVNLSFDRGEFVAITGKSGSGKSTLLNVISGMDTYEEGELYIEGEATSHYLQKDWEEYRKKYISFIFQDYNIVESFTVLENVELALMHIDDHKERRRRALELIGRVGLQGHIRHKGSQLSGGQKQRTVIARALAKDSPVLLADEPTGNLDSQTSKEIIALLREISREKLVIIVTHNFDQVADYATRHVRIFDGAVESDQVLVEADAIKEPLPAVREEKLVGRMGKTLKNGIHLGWVRFKAKPKLSFFLCILMCLAVVAASLVTALSSDASLLFDDSYFFTHIKGRTVIARKDGRVMPEEELQKLAGQVGADRYLANDYLLDRKVTGYLPEHFTFLSYICETDSGLVPDIGRRPEAVNEVMLSVPIGMQTYYGKDTLETTKLQGVFDGFDYTVVGVHYFYDNTKPSRMIFTEEGFAFANYVAIYQNYEYTFNMTLSVSASMPDGGASSESFSYGGDWLRISFAMEPGTYGLWVPDGVQDPLASYRENRKNNPGYRYTISGIMTANYGEPDYGYVVYDYNGYGSYPIGKPDGYGKTISHSLDDYRYSQDVPDLTDVFKDYYMNDCVMVLSPDVWMAFMEKYNAVTYTQASLFFDDDETAHEKVEMLRDLGYVAVPSDSEVERGLDVIFEILTGLFAAFFWLMAMLFIALFLNLCSNRAMMSSSGDVAIMRSMGIPVRVIRVSVYIQTLLSLIPAFLVSAAVFVFLYTFPPTNLYFTFLHAREYFLVALGVLIIAFRMSRRYVRKLFDQSVKKTLKGDVGE